MRPLRRLGVLIAAVMAVSAFSPVSVGAASPTKTANGSSTGGFGPAAVTLHSRHEAPLPADESTFEVLDMSIGQTGSVDAFRNGDGILASGNWGDFYFYDNPLQGGQRFWANNVGQQGVRDVTARGDFTRQGVAVVLDHVYQVIVEPGFVGFMTVKALSPGQVTLTYSVTPMVGGEGGNSDAVVRGLGMSFSLCGASRVAALGILPTVACITFLKDVLLAWVRPSGAS